MRNGSINISWVIAIVFIVLKMTEVINWSWLWVLSPLWIPIVLIIVTLIIGAIIYLLIISLGKAYTAITGKD